MTDKMREVPPITDETYKALMVALGMPNNSSLLSALQQIANHATQRAAWQAAQSVPADEDSVISIAGAYESGIGHCNDTLCNPYKAGSAESFAYDYGKEFGKSRGIAASVPMECCGCPVEGNEYMGQVQLVCCGNPEPAGVAASVQVVGKVVAWSVQSPCDFSTDFSAYQTKTYTTPLIVKPTHSITATELERLRKDAELGRVIREKYSGMKTSTSERFLEAIGVELDEDAAWTSYTLETLLGIDAAIAAEGEK